MDVWVGVTDNEWYHFLVSHQPDEVNFWQPSGTPPFRREDIELFLFKLHSPYNFIVGGGYFVTYVNLPVSIAWETFGHKNGVASYTELKEKISHYRATRRHGYHLDPDIGCSVLTNPFFFPEDEWIPIPQDWSSNIVRGKTYTSSTDVGKKLIDDVLEKITRIEALKSVAVKQKTQPQHKSSNSIKEQIDRYGREQVFRPRLGQGSFRAVVTRAYQKRCAMTGERTLPALEAAHIQSYSENGPHDVRNGLLLRADLHRLFDKHFITVTTDCRIEVSNRIREEYENGRDYYALHGKHLVVLPEQEQLLPSPQFLEWHNNQFTP
jgi:putative restriction endonuclease